MFRRNYILTLLEKQIQEIERLSKQVELLNKKVNSIILKGKEK